MGALWTCTKRCRADCSQKRPGHHCICAVNDADEDDKTLRAEYEALDYRLGGTKAFMAHELRRIPRSAAPGKIVRVLEEDLAESINKAARSRQILPEHLALDAPLRLCAGLIDDVPVGSVSSIDVGGMTWCAIMFVKANFRRFGIAKALMCKMLRDDRKYGSQLAVLTVSHVGAMLCPIVGYSTRGTVLGYTPRKK